MKKVFKIICALSFIAAEALCQSIYTSPGTAGPYYDNDIVYISCSSGETYFGQGNGYSFIPIASTIVPNSWNNPLYSPTTQPYYYTYLKPNGGQSGDVIINFAFGIPSVTLRAKVAPPVSFFSTPGLYGSNQSATYQVDVGTQIPYSTISWQTTGGLRVNGNTSYTGGTSTTVSTTSFGGKLKVRSNNSCGGNGDWTSEIVVGIPYISSVLVNGSSPQYPNYVNSSAVMNVWTDNTASACSWTVEGGFGTIYPDIYSPYNCEAYPNGFMRVQAQTSNQFGNGEAFMFYIQQDGYSGYRMASSNPTKSNDNIRIEFTEAKYADDLVEELALYSEKEKLVWSLSKEGVKSSKCFKDKSFVEIDTRKLSKGVYYLHLQIGGKKYSERLSIE